MPFSSISEEKTNISSRFTSIKGNQRGKGASAIFVLRLMSHLECFLIMESHLVHL